MESPRPTAQEQHFPSAMRAAEERLIADRRATAASLPESSASPRPQIGLALSGGGIRSATLSLGLVQVLARRDLLPHVDYLSTVSGGGYLGSFVGSLFARRGLPGGYQPAAEEPGARHAYVKQVLSEERPAPLAWLRQNGRYLTPNGSGDVLLAIAVALRNWIAVLVVMLTAALTIALGSHLVLGGIDALVGGFAPPEWKAIISGPHWIGDWLWWSPWFLAPVAVIALFAVPTGWAYWLVPMMHSKEGSWNWLNVTLPSLVTLITAVVSLLVAITGSGGETSIPPWLVTTCWVTGVIASLTLIYFLLVSLLTRKPVVYRSRISSWNAKALGFDRRVVAVCLDRHLRSHAVCGVDHRRHVAVVGGCGDRSGWCLYRDAPLQPWDIDWDRQVRWHPAAGGGRGGGRGVPPRHAQLHFGGELRDRLSR